ncbi:SRPBCC family protein [Paracraurococcus lichenis]|uniref:SRPBCC family protein n=1 Tax=Paracraurococcus lichenis TaxID=3064888 RepID=A0ABT9ECS7_9PROT|nr:SRPBCC family protein [Paracraurococcus sp. LOR1-02]MDO9713989.1 SRPBCC family protein [Paracraurococcus sp. LOR1-02]
MTYRHSEPPHHGMTSRHAHAPEFRPVLLRVNALGVALVAVAGVAAISMIGAQTLARGRTTRIGHQRGNGEASTYAHEPEVERSLTIEKPAEELHGLWREAETLPRVAGHIAQIRTLGDGETRWRVPSPFGRDYEWTMRLTEDRPGEVLRWKAADSASALLSDIAVRFRPASGGRGTVVTLRVRVDPPGGMLGEALLKLFGGVVPRELLSKSLHYFKSLAETGEIPTTERQPAARADTR